MQGDAGPYNWPDAISYCEGLSHACYDNWRLPNAKELQSIVDYTRSPDITDTAAIDSAFGVTQITNEGGQADFPFYWTSTTHKDVPPDGIGTFAVYISFDRASGL